MYNQTLKTFYVLFKSQLTFQTSKHNDLDINLHIPNAKPDCMFISSVPVPPTLAPGGPAAPALPGRPRDPLSPLLPLWRDSQTKFTVTFSTLVYSNGTVFEYRSAF